MTSDHVTCFRLWYFFFFYFFLALSLSSCFLTFFQIKFQKAHRCDSVQIDFAAALSIAANLSTSRYYVICKKLMPVCKKVLYVFTVIFTQITPTIIFSQRRGNIQLSFLKNVLLLYQTLIPGIRYALELTRYYFYTSNNFRMYKAVRRILSENDSENSILMSRRINSKTERLTRSERLDRPI